MVAPKRKWEIFRRRANPAAALRLDRFVKNNVMAAENDRLSVAV
jgi:hypothetical protein